MGLTDRGTTPVPGLRLRDGSFVVRRPRRPDGCLDAAPRGVARPTAPGTYPDGDRSRTRRARVQPVPRAARRLTHGTVTARRGHGTARHGHGAARRDRPRGDLDRIFRAQEHDQRHGSARSCRHPDGRRMAAVRQVVRELADADPLRTVQVGVARGIEAGGLRGDDRIGWRSAAPTCCPCTAASWCRIR